MILDILLTISAILLTIIFLRYKWNAGVKITNLSSKCVLVTGCDSGIGLAIAVASHAMGFRVIATCLNLSSDGALFLEKMCDKEKMLITTLDVTIKDQVESTLKVVKEYLIKTDSELWALVNNAGVLVYGQADWLTEEHVISQVDVNYVAVWRVTKAFLPLIRKSKGRVINITSATGTWPITGLSVYCGTKHALEGFTHALRSEMIPWGVKVILFNPGDLPFTTNIMARQSVHAEVMREQFSAEDLALYGSYFEAFQAHLVKHFGTPSKGPPEDAGLVKALEHCLLLKDPSHYYENLQVGFRLFVLLFKILPATWGDRLYLHLWGKQIGHKLL